jgi:hypothetical protein
MGERRKWFDPKNKHEQPPLPLPSPILSTKRPSQEQLEAFRDLLEQNRKQHSPLLGVSWVVFDSLLEMPARARLARNLKVVLDCLVRGPIESIMQDGLQSSEREALIALEKLDVSVEIKMTAQSLLNIYERYQLALSLGAAFT